MRERRLLLHLPILVFSFVWITVLPLYIVNPYHFSQLTVTTELTLFSGVLCVILGYYTTHVFLLPGKLELISSRSETSTIKFNERGFTKATLLITIIPLIGTIFAFLFIVELVGGYETFFTRPVYVRHLIVDFQHSSLKNWSFGFSFANYLISFIYICNLLGGVIYNFKSKYHYAGIIPVIIGGLASAVFIRRYVFINAASFWLFGFLFSIYFADSEYRVTLVKRFKRILILLFTIFLAFTIGILSLRVVLNSKISDFIIESIYSYYTGGVGAFNKLVSNNIDYTYGLTTFRSIFKWLSRLHLWDLDRIVGSQLSFIRVGNVYLNTYTYAYSFYKDFGFAGNMVLSFIWGGLTRWIMQKLYADYNLMRLFWAAAFTFSFMMSFYSFFFDGLSTILFWVFILYLVDRFFKNKKYYSVVFHQL